MIKLKVDAHDVAALMLAMSQETIEAKAQSLFMATRVEENEGKAREAEYDRDSHKREAAWAKEELDRSRAQVEDLKKKLHAQAVEIHALNTKLNIPNPLPAGFTQEQYDQVVTLMTTPYNPNTLMGGKIQAIKLVRAVTGLGLKEAKDLVEDGVTFVPNPLSHGDRPAINPPSMTLLVRD